MVIIYLYINEFVTIIQASKSLPIYDEELKKIKNL